MRIGEWELTSLLSGKFRLDGGAMFGVVPKTMWARRLPPDELNRIPMVMRVLVARGPGRNIIVDVGAGEGYSDKESEIYAFEETRRLPAALAASGIDGGDVTDVVLTHLHFDHGAGVVSPRGDGWEMVFPQATHHVQRSQWEHALAPNQRDRASYLKDRLEILEQSGVLKLHDGPWNLCPGFDLEVYDGHTPGQQLPLIQDADKAVFFCGDLVPTHHHLPAPYIMSYDLNPVLAMEEKVGMLEQALSQGWILFFEHDAAVEACRVRSEDGRVKMAEEISLQSGTPPE